MILKVEEVFPGYRMYCGFYGWCKHEHCTFCKKQSDKNEIRIVAQCNDCGAIVLFTQPFRAADSSEVTLVSYDEKHRQDCYVYRLDIFDKKLYWRYQEERQRERNMYYDSTRWNDLKVQVKLRANNICEVIGCDECVCLDVHHETYIDFLFERLEQLYLICRKHHDLIKFEFNNSIINYNNYRKNESGIWAPPEKILV